MTTSRRTAKRRLRQIDVYLPETPSQTDFNSVGEYLQSLLPPVRTSTHPPLLRRLRGTNADDIALVLASSRIKDPSSRIQSYSPMFGEIDYERRAIAGKAKVGGIVYDGRKIEEVCRNQLRDRTSVEICSIILTDRLLSTYSQDDLRHHLRTVVCGFPSIVSVPGIIEAPAKPKEYYYMKQQLDAAGAGEFELAKLRASFKGRFIDYGDPSLSEVLKGLALQAVFFHMTLEPFCEDPSCRLFNAHWQEELIGSQLTSGRLCPKHEMMLEHLRGEPFLAW